MGYNAIVSYLELNTTTSCLALWGSTCWYQDRVIVFFGCVYVYIYIPLFASMATRLVGINQNIAGA